jgi:hypothetical protein
MQLGKSLGGALIGGAIGIALLVGIHMLTRWDKAWLAILVASSTGMGVRWAASTRGHASYVRGALTAVVAILAFLAWYPIMAQITVRGAAAQPLAANRVVPEAAQEKTADADQPAEPPEETPRAAERPVADPDALPRPRTQTFSTWDFLWLCIAGLIAYELGRGTAAAAPAAETAGSPDDGPPPATAG